MRQCWGDAYDGAEDLRRRPGGSEFVDGEGNVEASPPVVAELPVIKLADLRLGPSPVPGNGGGDGANDDQGDAPCKGPPVAVLIPGTADTPYRSDGGDP